MAGVDDVDTGDGAAGNVGAQDGVGAAAAGGGDGRWHGVAEAAVGDGDNGKEAAGNCGGRGGGAGTVLAAIDEREFKLAAAGKISAVDGDAALIVKDLGDLRGTAERYKREESSCELFGIHFSQCGVGCCL